MILLLLIVLGDDRKYKAHLAVVEFLFRFLCNRINNQCQIPSREPYLKNSIGT